ncbi:class I SAM-dependent methyltransferase [Lacunimicrobium album]
MFSLFAKVMNRFEGFPPGHYYSPVPDFQEIAKDQSQIFDRSFRQISGIDLRIDAQKQLIAELIDLAKRKPFVPRHFRSSNGFFEGLDAFAYQNLIGLLKPKKIIEVGCGFSSALALDACRTFEMDDCRLIFIEPDPSRLNSLVQGQEHLNYDGIQSPVQTVDLKLFDSLESNDILFIDGSHVSKIHSDVNVLVFDVLPRLKPGVWVHFHDIFFPFEYPQSWVLNEKRAWNEAYLLRSFLMYNERFQIRFWSDFIHLHLLDHFPDQKEFLSKGGGSIWLQVSG